MNNVDLGCLRGYLAPSILEWLKEGEQLTSKFLDNCKTASDHELRRLLENNCNVYMKRTTCTWLRHYEKWAEHKGIQMDLADVPREELDSVAAILCRIGEDRWQGV